MFKRYFVTVRNIPWTICHLDLEKYFIAFGDIRHAKIVFDTNGISTGYGFVEFKEKLGMQNALDRMHILEGKEIIITEGIALTLHKEFANVLKTYVTVDFIPKYERNIEEDPITLNDNFEQ